MIPASFLSLGLESRRRGAYGRRCHRLEATRIFYRLHCQTRRRHGLPPQPSRFFENIGRHAFESGHGFAAIAQFEGRPIAAALLVHDHRQAIYKFAGSDTRFQHLRPNNLVLWAAVKHCADMGFTSLHLGRTSLENVGLRRFKLGFGAVTGGLPGFLGSTSGTIRCAEQKKYQPKGRLYLDQIPLHVWSTSHTSGKFAKPTIRP